MLKNPLILIMDMELFYFFDIIMILVITIFFIIMIYKYKFWKGIWLGGVLGFVYVLIDYLIIKQIVIKPCDSYCGIENLFLAGILLLLMVVGATIYGLQSKRKKV